MPEVDMIRAQLFALQDKEYQVFYSRLMPTLPPETVIGVRVPLLRKLAKQLADTPEAEVFLQELPHFYYEENALHAFLLESVRDYGTALAATERFLPYVDNWAVCDCFSPKVFAQHKPELLPAIRRWLGSDQVYTVRYGIGMLMRYYLDDAFRPEYLAWVAENPSLKDIGYVLGVQPFDCTPFYNVSLDFADKTVKNFNFLFSGAIFMLDSFVNENLFNQSI